MLNLGELILGMSELHLPGVELSEETIFTVALPGLTISVFIWSAFRDRLHFLPSSVI